MYVKIYILSQRIIGMLTTIIRRELLDQIKSFRFLLSFVLLVVVMTTSSVLFITTYDQQYNDYTRSRNETLDTLSRNATLEAALFRIYSLNYNGPWAYKIPNRLGFICDAHDGELPNAFSPSAFRIYGPTKRVRSNILLWKSSALDWSLIIGTILSFLVIVLVYDSICGEREQGTLRLVMANSVSRATFILGKFTGTLICISFTLLFSAILYILILITGGVPLQSRDFVVIGLSLLASIIYLSGFILLGLFVSGMTKNPASSLVISLLSWVILVIVIPGMGGLTASKTENLPSYERAREQATNAEVEAIRSYNGRNPEANVGYSGHWSPGEPLERAIVSADAWSESFDAYRNMMISQVEKARLLTLISPTAGYLAALESLSESGIVHYKWFLEQIREFKLTMRRSLFDVYPMPPKWCLNQNMTRQEMEREYKQLNDIKLSYENIPKFEEKRQGLMKVVSISLPYFLLLILFNIVFFVSAFVRFIRYDIR